MTHIGQQHLEHRMTNKIIEYIEKFVPLTDEEVQLVTLLLHALMK